MSDNVFTVYYEQSYYEPGYRTCPYCGCADSDKDDEERQCGKCKRRWRRLQMSADMLAVMESQRLYWNTFRE